MATRTDGCFRLIETEAIRLTSSGQGPNLDQFVRSRARREEHPTRFMQPDTDVRHHAVVIELTGDEAAFVRKHYEELRRQNRIAAHAMDLGYLLRRWRDFVNEVEVGYAGN